MPDRPSPPTFDGRLRTAYEAARAVVVDAFRAKVHVRSGFLALWCIEACVPLLVVGAVLAQPLGYGEHFIGGVSSLLGDSVFGATSVELQEYLTDLLDQASPSAVGVAGVLTSLFILWQLFAATLFDLHDLQWRDFELGHMDQAPKLLLFIGWLTLFLGGGVAATGALWAGGMVYLLPLPVLASIALLTGVIRFTGGADRTWRGALVGGVVGAVWWEILKTALWLWASSSFGSQSLDTTYRVLGFLPVFFLWMHGTFFSLLLAVIAARSHDAWEAVWRDHRWRRSGRRLRLYPDATLGEALVRHLRGAEDDRTLAHLAAAVDAHPGTVDATLDVLRTLELVEQPGPNLYRATGDADVRAAWEEAHQVG